MRMNGYGYNVTAKYTGINVNTVKSYCKRRGIVNKEKEHTKLESRAVGKKSDVVICKNCGVPVRQDPKRKKKQL